MSVGQLIRKYRNKQGLSQIQLAAKTGLTQKTISQFESDDMESRDSLVRIAEALVAPEILTAAIRGSVLMQRALQMMGYDSSHDEIESLVQMAQQEIDGLRQNLEHEPRAAKLHAERLADLAQALQLLIPIMSKTP